MKYVYSSLKKDLLKRTTYIYSIFIPGAKKIFVPTLKKIIISKITELIRYNKINLKTIKKKLPPELFNLINDDFACIRVPPSLPSKKVELMRHEGDITCIYNDRYMVNLYITGSHDKMAYVWDIISKECLLRLEHKEAVYLAYINTKMLLAITITIDNTMYLWNILSKNDLIGKIYLEKKINKIKDIENERYLLLATSNKYLVFDIVNLEIVDSINKVSVRILKESHGKYTCYIKDNKIIICDLINNNGKEIVINQDAIRDISYLDDTQCFVSCSRDNIINIWNIDRNEKRSTNIIDPLLIRKFDNKNLLLVNKIGMNIYGYEMFNLDNNSTHRITMFSINKDNEYIPLNTKIIILHQMFAIITKFEDVENNKIWMICTFLLSKVNNDNNIIFNQYETNTKPVNINGKYLIILIDKKIILLDLINNKIDDKSLNYQNDDVTYITKNKTTSFIMLGFRSGRCYLHQIAVYLTLKECLFLSELDKCKNDKVILDYKKKYNTLFSNNYTTVFAICRYAKELEEYLEYNKIKTKAYDFFNKDIEKIGFFEICYLCGYEYYYICM